MLPKFWEKNLDNQRFRVDTILVAKIMWKILDEIRQKYLRLIINIPSSHNPFIYILILSPLIIQIMLMLSFTSEKYMVYKSCEARFINLSFPLASPAYYFPLQFFSKYWGFAPGPTEPLIDRKITLGFYFNNINAFLMQKYPKKNVFTALFFI